MHAALTFAKRLADAADELTLARFRALDLHVERKPDMTPVSEADRAAEMAIRSLVAAERRGEGVLGEEFGDDGGEVRWIVDPIDGTKNYVRGIPVWATLLALERHGVVELAFVSAPALGRRWWAWAGGGAWSDGRRCRVSAVGRLDDATVSTTAAPAMPPGWEALARRAYVSRGFGDFWQYCLLAEGGVDVACDERLQLWDYAGLSLLVTEAGGHCSTFEGGAPSPGAGFLATNGVLHDAAVTLLGTDGSRS